ncbi:bifunctional riboflavin kinase/FAD synthetase [Prevotella cerevisiae]|uniref:Riboflavin biosynthesis protein n=1 Tax=Segatella cerevisiae TaxID=2053716 RepID=A0ABT1BX81_9BACT|nr:bifunctional riboflavin kinase/FAD synthetase [Segatella cerevisiae]MCO6025579.1 bifunctional riboflavin kinase/FAD synthetase [Segatella cerevisiae]
MDTIYLDNNHHLQAMKPCVATIGFFDGVHRGHQFLIKQVVDDARREGLESLVITFDQHPRKVLQSDYQPQLLSTLDEKLVLLSKTEIDHTVVLHFDKAMASLSAYDFMAQVLRDKLKVKKLFIGYDNRFGHNRAEGFNEYVKYGQQLGIEVLKSTAFVMNGVNVSSTVIRSLLKDGEVELANHCLGYPYTLFGRVVRGFQQGRKLGFPTANLDSGSHDQLIPAQGVYAVMTRIEGSVVYMRSMMDIGTRPTFNGRNLTLEVNIFHFEGDIYGKKLFVSLMHRIREDKKFPSVKALQDQLFEDRRMVNEQFDKDLENE